MNRLALRGGALLLTFFVAACAPDTDVDDEASADDALTAMPSGLYFAQVRHDTRRCVSPVCGGEWVHRINRETTVCADGRTAAECYVATIDWSGSGLNEAEVSDVISHGYLVRGRIVPRAFGTFGTLGVFVVTEAWRAGSDSAPTGTFTFNHDNGIRCVRAPCFSIDSQRVNSTSTSTLSSIDFTRVPGVEPALVRGAGEQLHMNGVIVAGSMRTGRDGGRTLTASQFYLRAAEGVRPEQFCVADAECVRTSYSREVTAASECYCTVCPTTVVNTATASVYASSYERFRCASRATRCPLPPCANPPGVACVNHACVSGPRPE